MRSPRARKSQMNSSQKLIKKIESRTAHLGVIGLGYVGLPLAVEFAQAGYRVTGIDVDEKRVNELKKGRSYVQDVATRDVRSLTKSGHLEATTDFSVLKRVDAVNVCVPVVVRNVHGPVGLAGRSAGLPLTSPQMFTMRLPR